MLYGAASSYGIVVFVLLLPPLLLGVFVLLVVFVIYVFMLCSFSCYLPDVFVCLSRCLINMQFWSLLSLSPARIFVFFLSLYLLTLPFGSILVPMMPFLLLLTPVLIRN